MKACPLDRLLGHFLGLKILTTDRSDVSRSPSVYELPYYESRIHTRYIKYSVSAKKIYTLREYSTRVDSHNDNGILRDFESENN